MKNRFSLDDFTTSAVAVQMRPCARERDHIHPSNMTHLMFDFKQSIFLQHLGVCNAEQGTPCVKEILIHRAERSRRT